jgi:two-component system sensor histidine kinase ChiS
MTDAPVKDILVVEDDEGIRESVTTFLEMQGYRVRSAGDGFQAMELLKSGPMPNLVLLDMKMPIMNGWQVAIEFLDKHDHLSPFVVMTAAADAQQRAKDVSAVGWLAKPFTLDELLVKVLKHAR